jgi:sortase A
LWSRNRIEGYQDSLGQHLAPTLAVLRIPRIKLEAPMLEGTADLTLNRGVGRIEGTSHLGENGNIGIAGHRDGFFRGLKDINLGDKLELEGPERTYIYIVDKLQVVDPHDVRVLRATSTPSLTLVTCYPFYFIGSAPQRYIVHASAITDF